MTMEDFINKHRDALDDYIHARPGMQSHILNLDDDDREQWIMNDESLYNWAESEGVEV